MNIKTVLMVGLISLFNLNCPYTQAQDTLETGAEKKEKISIETINDTAAMEGKTVFEKQLDDHVCIRQVLTSDEKGDYLTLFLIDDRLEKRVKIGELTFERPEASSVGDLLLLGIMPSVLSCKLLDAVLLGNSLFFIETDSGKLVFTHLQFHDGYEFDVKYKNKFGEVRVIPSTSNGGYYVCEFKYHAGNLFFYLYASDYSKLEGVYCYNTQCNSLIELEEGVCPL